MADASVRPANSADAEPLAAIQIRAWQFAYEGVWPVEVLDSLAAAQTEFAAQWLSSITAPPTQDYRVLVACVGPSVVGGAAFGPATDEDANRDTTSELYVLMVTPENRSDGHASRLLSATVDHLRGGGFRNATAWVDAADDGLRGLLDSAGWAPDGSHRALDYEGDGSVVLNQVRLHTDLREGT